MTKHETINKIKELLKYLAFANTDHATAVITVPNDAILKLVAEDYGCHVYEPYEIIDNNEERQFDVVVDNVRITVKSKEKYRKHSTLIAY